MYKLDFNKPINVHFIGIGGISMSGLAEILIDKGFKVTGSDSQPNYLTGHLEDKGAIINYPQSKENIAKDIDLIVYSAAIHEDNIERVTAVELDIPQISRAELLGEFMLNYKNAINIAGTHGKTTTTSMMSEIFLKANSDPTILVGGVLDDIAGNMRLGKDDYFIVEACEYTNSFLSFHPTASMILNIEADHLDFFKDLDDIRHSFKQFIDMTSDVVVINNEIENYEELVKDTKAKVITFGLNEEADYYAKEVSYDELVNASFDVYHKGELLGRVELAVPGSHNVYNALASVACALHYNIDFETVCDAFRSYHGTHRRFEIKGTVNGCKVVDDYAHHPAEIEAVLKVANNYPHNKIWAVFQPFTYTRTVDLLDDFAKVLLNSDMAIVSDICAGREENTMGITGEIVINKMKEMSDKCIYLETFDDIINYAKDKVSEGDLFITMGCGDVYKLADRFVKEYGDKDE